MDVNEELKFCDFFFFIFFDFYFFWGGGECRVGLGGGGQGRC